MRVITVDSYHSDPADRELAHEVLAKVTNVVLDQCYRIEISAGSAKVYAYKWRNGKPYTDEQGDLATFVEVAEWAEV